MLQFKFNPIDLISGYYFFYSIVSIKNSIPFSDENKNLILALVHAYIYLFILFYNITINLNHV